MCFSQILTGLKCRTHSELAKYGLSVEASDIFGPRIRESLLDVIATLPEHTHFATREQLDFVDHISEEVAYFQARIMDTFEGCRETTLLKSLPRRISAGPTSGDNSPGRSGADPDVSRDSSARA